MPRRRRGDSPATNIPSQTGLGARAGPSLKAYSPSMTFVQESDVRSARDRDALAHGAGSNLTIGRLVALDQENRPLVDYPGLRSSEPVLALCTSALSREHLGGDVLLTLHPTSGQPIVIDAILDRFAESQSAAREEEIEEEITVERDGRRLTLTAEHEIVLRCGEASITLTREGRILTRGTNLVSRASGVHRIKGGTVQIN